MFDNIKNLYNLKKQAEELQKQMGNEKFAATSGLVTLTINGNQELLEVQISETGELDRKQLARDFKAAFSRAQDEMKRTMAQKFKGMI